MLVIYFKLKVVSYDLFLRFLNFREKLTVYEPNSCQSALPNAPIMQNKCKNKWNCSDHIKANRIKSQSVQKKLGVILVTVLRLYSRCQKKFKFIKTLCSWTIENNRFLYGYSTVFPRKKLSEHYLNSAAKSH